MSLSLHPDMTWWRDARFGMFIHWGLYAILSGEWNGERPPGAAEWIMNRARIPVREYEKLAEQFNRSCPGESIVPAFMTRGAVARSLQDTLSDLLIQIAEGSKRRLSLPKKWVQ
jgi:hypothetical protein